MDRRIRYNEFFLENPHVPSGFSYPGYVAAERHIQTDPENFVFRFFVSGFTSLSGIFHSFEDVTQIVGCHYY